MLWESEKIESNSGWEIIPEYKAKVSIARNELVVSMVWAAKLNKLSKTEKTFLNNLLFSMQQWVYEHLKETWFLEERLKRETEIYKNKKLLSEDETCLLPTCEGCSNLTHHFNNASMAFGLVRCLWRMDEKEREYLVDDLLSSFNIFNRICSLIEIMPKDMLENFFDILAISEKNKIVESYSQWLKRILNILKELFQIHLEPDVLELPSSTTQSLQPLEWWDWSDISSQVSAA